MTATERDIQKVVNKLGRLPKAYRKKILKKIYRENAKPVIKAAKNNIPKSSKTVNRYSGGQIVASYSPGTLRRSIGVLPLRRSDATYVGPRTGRGRKNDGYFGGFLEKGTVHFAGIHFLERAFIATKTVVLSRIRGDLEKVLKDYIGKNRIL